MSAAPTAVAMGGQQGVAGALVQPTCDEALCNGRGSCVIVDDRTGCDCLLGYQGLDCGESVNQSLSLPLTLGVLVVLVACIILAFVWARLRQTQKAQRRKEFSSLTEGNGVEMRPLQAGPTAT